MKNKTISLSDYLIEKLKREENASLLISQLLNSHYEINNVDTLRQKITDEITQKEQFLIWGKEFRENSAKEGRDTDLKIMAWLTGASWKLQSKWEKFKKFENEQLNK